MIFKGFSGKQSCHVFGQIGGKCHLSSGYRMEKAKTVRVKRLPVDQFHIRIVQIISDQGITEVLHMNPYLMGAAGL